MDIIPRIRHTSIAFPASAEGVRPVSTKKYETNPRSAGILAFLLLTGCAAGAVEAPATVAVPAGPFIEGSSAEERAYAYRLDEAAYGHSRTREAGWYDREAPRGPAETGAFASTIGGATLSPDGSYVIFTHPGPLVPGTTGGAYAIANPRD